MFTDLPLSEKGEDNLGRYLFAEEIANGLVYSFGDNTESLVIGINGAWGSGKSTLVNFIIKEVERLSAERDETVIVLPFNPWMFSGQSELQSIFLKELFLKFESKREKLKKASKKLADFLGHFTWLKYAHSGTGEAVKDAQTFFAGLTKEKNLQELKTEVDKILIKSGVKLYITIDDIDRLTPSEITDIFQLVKLNGNFANTVFLLAYDRDVVTKALEKQFGVNGKKYIEKIVQVDYTLPEVSRDNIERIFVDSINNTFAGPEINKAISVNFKNIKGELFVKLFTSLRDIYRFINGLRLRLPSIYQELNLRDFFIVEALRVFNPLAYNFILNSKIDLTQNDKSQLIYPSHSASSKTESKSEFIDKQQFDDLTKNLIKDLFELRNKKFFQFEEFDDLIREKRIANPNYFDRYFNLQLSDFDLQESLFMDFIESDEIKKKIEILESVKKRDRLFHFLNWIELKSKKASQKKIELMIYSVLKFSDSVKYLHEHSLKDTDFMTLQRFASHNLEHLKDPQARKEVIQKHITDTERDFSFSSCFTIAGILRASKMRQNRELQPYHSWYFLFSPEEENEVYVDKLWRLYKTAIQKVFIKYQNDSDFLNGNELFWLLPDLKTYHSSFYDREFKKLIRNDQILLLVLAFCITQCSLSSGATVGYRLAKEQLLSGMEPEELKKRLEKLDLEKLSKDEAATAKFFLKSYEEGFDENRYYDFYTLVHVGDW